VAQALEQLQSVVSYRTPLWAIPQAFGGYGGWSRVPTPEEERNMVYQCLVHGARGLVFYTYWDGRFAMADHPKLWIMMQRLAREVKQLAPALLASPPSPPAKAGPGDAVHLLRTTYEDSEMLLMVNTTREDLGAVRLSLPGLADGRLRGLFDEHAAPVRAGVAAIEVPSLAVRVFRHVPGP
jgi:hypothetical protein